MKNIFCYIEIEENAPTNASLELLGEAMSVARNWGGHVIALVLSATAENQEAWAETLGFYGANEVLLAVSPRLENYSAVVTWAAISQVLEREEWAAFFAPHSANGADFAPRLAASLQLEMVSDCVQITGEKDGKLTLTRPIYSDRLHAHYQFDGQTQVIATFRHGARGLDIRPVGTKAEVRVVTIDLLEIAGVQSLGVIPPDPETVDLVEAERIVAFGLGLPHPLGLELSQALAEQLGAAVGATRPIIDKGWLPFERQIGTTGRTVAPRLYVALGISGASQHVGGIRGAKNVIAINLDRSAPLMALADFAVVGDAKEIVPLLVNLLQSRKRAATSSQTLATIST